MAVSHIKFLITPSIKDTVHLQTLLTPAWSQRHSLSENEQAMFIKTFSGLVQGLSFYDIYLKFQELRCKVPKSLNAAKIHHVLSHHVIHLCCISKFRKGSHSFHKCGFKSNISKWPWNILHEETMVTWCRTIFNDLKVTNALRVPNSFVKLATYSTFISTLTLLFYTFTLQCSKQCMWVL